MKGKTFEQAVKPSRKGTLPSDWVNAGNKKGGTVQRQIDLARKLAGMTIKSKTIMGA